MKKLFVAVVLAALSTSAHADWCATDINGSIVACGYATMGQCMQIARGLGGTCVPGR